jgi:hypothetical protein
MSVRTLGAKDELKWPITRRFGRTVQVSKLLFKLFLTEVYLLLFKRTKLSLKRLYLTLRGRRPENQSRM